MQRYFVLNIVCVLTAVGSLSLAHILAGYWFTSSTSFANPGVTIARVLTDSFTGIRPVDALAFIAAQLAGACAATFLSGWLWRSAGRGRARELP